MADSSLACSLRATAALIASVTSLGVLRLVANTNKRHVALPSSDIDEQLFTLEPERGTTHRLPGLQAREKRALRSDVETSMSCALSGPTLVLYVSC